MTAVTGPATLASRRAKRRGRATTGTGGAGTATRAELKAPARGARPRRIAGLCVVRLA